MENYICSKLIWTKFGNEKSPSVLAEHVLINSYREDWHFDDKSVDQTIGV